MTNWRHSPPGEPDPDPDNSLKAGALLIFYIIIAAAVLRLIIAGLQRL